MEIDHTCARSSACTGSVRLACRGWCGLIEALVRACGAFPAPARMGRVTYTDVWLWDATGQFQLNTLTEGQL